MSFTYGPLCRVASTRAPLSRSNNRKSSTDLRPVYLRPSTLSTAAGSAYFEAGDTKVFVSIHGPRPSPAAASIEATVHAELRFSSFSGRATSTRLRSSDATDEERELGAALARTMAAVVRLEMYPKTRIEVSAFVLEDDGGAFAAAVTAAGMAMADAGIEMMDLVAGCAAAVMEDGEIVVDPDRKEEGRAVGSTVIGYMPGVGKVTDVVGMGEADAGKVVEMLKVCCEGAERVVGLMRKALEKSARRLEKKRERMEG